jgi:hypothetical protein
VTAGRSSWMQGLLRPTTFKESRQILEGSEIRLDQRSGPTPSHVRDSAARATRVTMTRSLLTNSRRCPAQQSVAWLHLPSERRSRNAGTSQRQLRSALRRARSDSGRRAMVGWSHDEVASYRHLDDHDLRLGKTTSSGGCAGKDDGGTRSACAGLATIVPDVVEAEFAHG